MAALLLLSSTLVGVCIQLLTVQPDIATHENQEIALEQTQYSEEVNALEDDITEMLLQRDMIYYPEIETSAAMKQDNEES